MDEEKLKKTIHATIAEELRNEEILESNDPSKDIAKKVAEDENLEKAIDDLIGEIDFEEEVEAAEGIAIEVDEIQQLDSDEKLGDDIFDALEDYYDIKNKNNRVSQADIWLEFLRMYQHDCPSLAITIMLLLVIPASNAGIEQMFSILKLMKPKNRSRMSAFVLRQRLRIASYFDVNNYDATKLYEKFHSLK